MVSRTLILLFARLFTATLPGQGFLNTLFLAWLEVEAVTLHFLNDVLLLDLAFEAAKSVLEGFALLNFDFCHGDAPPNRPNKTYLESQVSPFPTNKQTKQKTHREKEKSRNIRALSAHKGGIQRVRSRVI